MSKPKKLKISELKLESFITSANNQELKHVRGGVPTQNPFTVVYTITGNS